MNSFIRKSPFVAAVAGAAFMLGCGHGPEQTQVWCNVFARPCISYDDNVTTCLEVGADTVLVTSDEGGAAVCLEPGDTRSAADICTAQCAALAEQHPLKYPSADGCFATVNTNPTYHPNLNAENKLPNSCGPTEEGICFNCSDSFSSSFLTASDKATSLSKSGTNSARLGGAGTVTSNGSSQPVSIESGYIVLNAPNTSCSPTSNACPVRVEVANLTFAPFPFNGRTITDLKVRNTDPVFTAPGQFDPGSGLFLFTLPAGIAFAAAANVDGSPGLIEVASTVGVAASLNPQTGRVTFQYQFSGDVEGTPFTATGIATTTEVVGIGPTLSAPTSISVDATSSCSANVTLSATATSPIGLPVTIQYAVDFASIGTGASATVSLPVGPHSGTITAIDSQGRQRVAMVPITVNDRSVPVFGNVAPSVTVNTCNLGATSVPITVPTAQGGCGGGAATVTGRVISFNGAAVSIPVVNGTVSVPPGSGTIEFTATGTNGATSRVTQTITVVGPAAVFGQRGVSIADGASVSGTIYSGAGGQVVLGNDVTVGNVFSLSPVLLRDRVTTGLIQTNAGVTPGNNDHIGGILNTTPTLSAFPQLAAVINGSQNIVVNPDASRTLAPGRYANVTVFSRGKLILSTGNYEFTSLDLEPQASLIVPSTSVETAKLLVKTSVIYRGRTTVQSGATAPLYLGYTGTGAFFVESPPFTGTLVSPNAALNLQSLNGAGSYRGEFFAKNVNLGPHTAIVSVPFTCH